MGPLLAFTLDLIVCVECSIAVLASVSLEVTILAIFGDILLATGSTCHTVGPPYFPEQFGDSIRFAKQRQKGHRGDLIPSCGPRYLSDFGL